MIITTLEGLQNLCQADNKTPEKVEQVGVQWLRPSAPDLRGLRLVERRHQVLVPRRVEQHDVREGVRSRFGRKRTIAELHNHINQSLRAIILRSSSTARRETHRALPAEKSRQQACAKVRILSAPQLSRRVSTIS
jgi:hypothetical protein